MLVFLTLMMTVAFPGGVSYDIRVSSVQAPSMEACMQALEQAPTDSIVTEDGTIIHTYFQCGQGV